MMVGGAAAEGTGIGLGGGVRFMGIALRTAPGVLVPREETELVGQQALALLRERGPGQRAIDMCCGAGNLACAVASALPDLTVDACDLTDSAVALARSNVAALGLSDRVAVHQGDLFSPLAEAGLGRRIDVVMCNPPYISTARLAGDRAHLLDNEPREAFDAGPYGIAIHARVIDEARPFLKGGGWLVLEFGEGQERQLALLFKRAGGYDEPQLLRDGHGVPRAVMARRSG